MALLQLKDVSYTYPDSPKPALDNITFALETGQHVVLLGANGSGKSTLARVAAGLLMPASGEVVMTGFEDQAGWNGVGLLFQNPDEQLLTHSVEAELAWGLENLGLLQDEMRRRIGEALELFELSDKANSSPDTLSDGWKQVTALASLAVMRPAFLILDEATAFLDPYWTAKIKGMVRGLIEVSGLLWITADGADAIKADRVLGLVDGQLIADGNPREVLQPERLEALGIEPVPDWVWNEEV